MADRIGAGRTMTYGFVLVALGMAVMAGVSVDSPYLVLVLGMFVASAGMAITAAPATGSILVAVPLNRAGVASAVNDTTRELGGALGIAVFGSIANSVYRSNIDLAGLDLPAAAGAEAEESIGGAVGAAGRAGSDGGAIVERAATAFTDAFNVASMVSVGIAVVGAAVVARVFTRAKEQSAGEVFIRCGGRGRRGGHGRMTTCAPRRPTRDPDPRIERTRRAVLDSALALLDRARLRRGDDRSGGCPLGRRQEHDLPPLAGARRTDPRRLPRAQADDARADRRLRARAVGGPCSRTWLATSPPRSGRHACRR